MAVDQSSKACPCNYQASIAAKSSFIERFDLLLINTSLGRDALVFLLRVALLIYFFHWQPRFLGERTGLNKILSKIFIDEDGQMWFQYII